MNFAIIVLLLVTVILVKSRKLLRLRDQEFTHFVGSVSLGTQLKEI